MRTKGDSKVLGNQVKYQQNSHLHGADNPTYLKNGSSDKMVTGALYVFAGFTFLGIARGMWNMSHGINKA